MGTRHLTQFLQFNYSEAQMKQKLVEMMKNTKVYNKLRDFFYSTNINDYKGDFLNSDKAQEYIEQLINSKVPFMVSRFGSNELSVLKNNISNHAYSEKQITAMKDCAGFFPVTDSNLDKFSDLYFSSISKIDFLGIWMNPFEDKIANKYCPEAKLTKLRNLEPYFSKKPWTKALKNKKVLVIHPFTESIEKQYKKRELLFKNKNLLPAFELITYQAVQSLGGEASQYTTWFEALDGMKSDISGINFDIAIIGAGAYGLPLAAYIKTLGKSAIHLGGATQLLFGIYGQRWAANSDFDNIINEYWVKPLYNEKPQAAKNVENSCYW
jgi:hypothetical protein